MRARIAADDIETARQAVIALAEVGGDAASGALVLALEHPNMNIKKAAAAGLVRCGDAEAIDRLLFWLGHHDNPGLRTELLAALRALLGAALPMTLLAAIAAAEDRRRRGLLLDALAEGSIPGDPGGAPRRRRGLDRRAPRARRRRSSAADASARGPRGRARRPPPRRRSAGRGQARATAIVALERRGLDPEVADGLLELRRQRPLRGDELALLRPHLAGWLELCAAAEAPAARPPAPRRRGPPPAPHKRRGRPPRAPPRAPLRGARRRRGRARPLPLRAPRALIDALDVGARWLVGVDLRALVTASRALLWGRSPITALRRCGLLVTRGDVEAALLAARRSADPPELQRRILRDAFVGGERPSITAGALSKAAREALGRALKSPEANDLAALRARWEAPPRATIAALVDAYPDLDGAHQGPLLDWLCELQPPGSPIDARPPLPPAPSERRPRASDLDQPISEVQLDRLRAELDDPKRSRAAATRLLERAEHLTPALRDHLLQLYLGGALGPADPLGRPALAALAETLANAAEPPALAKHLADPAWLARLDNLVHGTGANRPLALLPALVDAWPRAPEADGARRRIRAMIDAFSPEAVRLALQAPLLRGEWGYLDLLRPPLRPSTLDAALRDAARQGGGEALLARVDALHAPPTPPPDPPAAIPSEALVDRPRDELFALLRDTDRRGPLDAQAAALKALARAPDAPFVALCRELVAHPHPRLRLAAYRQLRRHGTRDEALAAARQLLGDPRPDIQRSAIASLGHARDLAALPALVELTGHRHNGVRRAAIDALRLYGAPAREALEIALRGARPDRRRALAEVLTLIDGPPG
ncbi:MAG: HEAT repeat domain-containing protein [Myxococcales bacterium]|nr:HEAT repeat domain-containing protein [Myxococcales bacterium]